MTPGKSKTFDGYIRVSRTGGRSGDTFRSPIEQRETIERLALGAGLTLGEIIEEMDVSGGKNADQREMGRLVQRVLDGESGGLIVWKVSRFSRDMVDGIITAGKIREAGGRIIGSDLDSSAPMGRALMGFLLGWAEEERELRTEGWASAKRAARKRGVHISGRTPYGYKQTKTADGDAGPLVQVPKQAAVVEKVYRRRAAGAGFQEVCDKLGGHWTEGSLRKLVGNPIYKGEPRGGDEMPEDVRAGLKIVSARMWEKAQCAPGRATRTKDGALLAGLVRCGSCGGACTTTSVDYRCKQRASGTSCSAPVVVSGRILEPFVVDAALTRLHTTGAFAHSHRSGAELDVEREAVADAIHDRDEFERTALAEGMKPAQVARYAAQYEEVVAAAQDALAAAQEQADVHSDVFSVAQGRETFESATVPKQRAVMTDVLRGVTVQRGRKPIAERASLDWKRAGSCAACGALLAESAGCEACGTTVEVA